MNLRQKRIGGECPQKFIKLVGLLAEIPKSPRIAEEFCEESIALLKKFKLWIPIIPYKAQLVLTNSSEYCGIHFERGILYDSTKAVVSVGRSADAVEVLREPNGSWEFLPTCCRIFEFDRRAQVCGTRTYNLLEFIS